MYKVEDYPKEVVDRLLEIVSGNSLEIKMEKLEMGIKSAFIWADTEEGYDFWNTIYNKKDFSIFFEKYPRKFHIKYNI